MNILVIGGTRYFGVHLVRALQRNGHQVTIATRGLTKDDFGGQVNRIIIDRTDESSVKKELGEKYYDVIIDNIAYSSMDVKYLLDVVKYGKYILTSTLSVYDTLHQGIMEEEFNPLTYPLNWCSRSDYTYDEVKRQAECALFQVYSQYPKIAVRFPFVIGEDDYTKRLYFYVENCVKGIPMYIDNLNDDIGFISSKEAGEFLAWLADINYSGILNGSNPGAISLKEVLRYVEEKTGCKAVLAEEGQPGPYNGATSYDMDITKANKLGFAFRELKEWIYSLLDYYIEAAKK